MVKKCLLHKTLTVVTVCICIMQAYAIPSQSTKTAIFSRDVRTLTLRNPDNFMSRPVIRQNSNDRLSLSFDIIGESHEYLRYRLLHYNSDWQLSQLLETEYLKGFNEAEVTDYAYSSNTFTHYVNYRISIPNPDMQPLSSGNYLIQIYREENPDSVLLQQRFQVSENAVKITGGVSADTDRGFNSKWQQVNLDIDLSGFENADPYHDLKVTVIQNNCLETLRTVYSPLRVNGHHALFLHNPSLIFNAGNEYRRFETVQADSPGMHVDSVAFLDNNWHAYLSPDTPQIESQYIYDRTQYGRYKVDEYNSTDPDLGADYVTVHFFLDMQEISGMNVYVDGELSLDSFNDSNRMIYDSVSNRYVAEILLKQGSYNYRYAVVPHDGGPPDFSIVDGDKFETNNEYLVNVFYRPPGARADRLIGSLLIE